MILSDELIYFWLGVSGIGARRANKLLAALTPFELWEGVGDGSLGRNLFGDKYDALVRFRNEDFLARSIDSLTNRGISYITRDRFPERLIQSEVDPPVMLYYRGDISLIETDCIAMVGTRACSSYGRDAATRLATDLCAYNVTIVSGLATGIDSSAHRATLKAGGKTIAVLGSGLDCVTPVSNYNLCNEIIESGGLVLSEYSPRFEGMKFSFPERNRIISGLSVGVIVVEAGLKSGALITANYAAEQNRYVFAVPGSILSGKSLGSNRLLYDGAIPALTAEDICDTLKLSAPKIEKISRAIQLDIFEEKIYNILQSGDESFDSLVEKTDYTPARLSALLSLMEIKGAVRKKQSNIYSIE